MADRTTAVDGYARTAIQKTALVFGIVFLVIGIAGFIPGLTHSMEEMEGAGADSQAMLFGVFQVSILHNVVHLLFGVVGLAVAARARASRQYLIWGGVVYAVLLVYGLFAVNVEEANFVPVNVADNWLHAVLAVAMILLGIFVDRDRTTTTARRRTTA
ncbi:DUF4383 domain-containing protein [Microbacterium sp. CFBP9034]|uniref:DUF4383 domain-containing protein n=1 Tax=Microbacterium sp. CFBP9034 TaxID=3096540 RepID=UPI002A69EB15|nr:DUF4383 domain-containing protein [Microbacterium sp. CFBP9034]MDY0908636.1 DUF4383 domain-containing protein [Microbacterium sp. CFBP9034]